MVLGSSAEGASHAQRTIFRVRRANQSIKEAAGKQSDAEISSLLRKKDMDFDDSEHRLLNQDPIYEARWRNRKNGNTGYRGLADTRKFAEHKVQRSLIHTSLDHNGRKGGYARKSGPVVIQKYRIVSDNRSKPNSDTSVKPESAQNSDNSGKQVAGDVADSGNFVERVISPFSEGQIDSRQGHASLEFSMGDGQLIPELKMSASSLSTMDEGCIKNEKEVHCSMLVSATMAIGMYSSATDPVHVPSADSRSAGAIGAARRHVGVVGSQRQTCNHPSTRTSVANATLSNMEWRPKSSQKSRISSPSSQVEANGLSERVTQVNILDGGCVIIPKHLKVPEAEQIHLTFGSFGDGFDSKSATFLTCENDDRSSDKPPMRQSMPVPVGSPKNTYAVAKVDLASSNIESPQSDSSPSAAESEQALLVLSESSSPKDIHSYADINMVLSHNPSFNPFKPQQSENSPSMQYFLGYGQQAARDCSPFPTAVIDENAHSSLSSTSETLALNATCSIRQSSVTTAQQQQQQLPAVSQLYPQVHIPHFTNFAPYQHMMTPMYVPPMAMPNYSGNPAYVPSQNGSSCLFMQGGNSNVAVGGLKYTAQQYKPVHAGNPVGYASYACPAGYTVGTVGTVVRAANANDMAGFKYMDSDLYAPNLQVETLLRDLAGVHPSPYELLGQGAMTHAAYVPTHTGRAVHGGAHSSYLQYPSGLYHPSLPGSVASHPHHLARQQVLLSGAGAAVAAHIDPAGTYEQPQLSHADWPANF